MHLRAKVVDGFIDVQRIKESEMSVELHKKEKLVKRCIKDMYQTSVHTEKKKLIDFFIKDQVNNKDIKFH